MQPETKRPSLFANRDFVLLFGGSGISAIGDQFTLVALPWLVLKLTNNPGALGLVLAVMALPRAAFMLIGGAVVDRMSPRRVLLVSRAVNAAFVTLLALLVLFGTIQMWMLYAIAVGIGLSTAFAFPAGSAILPQLVEAEQLQAANGLVMGLRQVSLLVGPVLAGLLITGSAASASSGHAGLAEARGMGLAFGIDALSFLFSLASLFMIRLHSDDHPPRLEGGVLADVAKGVRHLWADTQMRAFILYVALVSVFVGGPVQVGLPLLADTRLHHGAASLGILMTAYGGGILLGNVASRPGLKLSGGRLGLLILIFDSLAGLLLAALPLTRATWLAAFLLVVMGAFAGVAQVGVMSWIQRRVPMAMMGRTMSILFFIFMGVGPISAAAAGALLKVIPLTTMFAGAGLILTAIALSCLALPSLRHIGVPSPAAPQTPD
ncbi:MAG: MFS transporter [Acidobacteria bacterium]|nr:MFS transporter [Acidobacteriota bacterium]MBI3489595.1 MFS transporter [Acidobacteriota bacterium]